MSVKKVMKKKKLKDAYVVLKILTKNALLQIFSPIPFVKKKKDTKSQGRRIRKSLENLGTTYIKLGQMLSTRYDLFPKDILEELSKLQDDVPPLPKGRFMKELKKGYGDPKTVFKHVESKPLASASIAQVHRATLINGDKVVIKMRRPGISKQIKKDIEDLRSFTSLTRFLPIFKNVDIDEIIKEFGKNLQKEMDFCRESEDMNTFNEAFSNNENIYAPSPYPELSRRNILVMEYIEGESFADLMRGGMDKMRKEDRKQVVERVGHSLLEQLLVHGFIHSDPHPGNLVLTEGNKICYIDFGKVTHLDPDTQRFLIEYLLAMVKRDPDLIADIVMDKFSVENADTYADDIKDMFTKYYGKSLKEIEMGEVVTESFRVNRAHSVKLPPQVFLLGRVIMLVEGVGTKVDPDFDFISFAKQYFSRDRVLKLIKRRLNLLKEDSFWSLLMLPRKIKQFEKILTGKGKFTFQFPSLERRFGNFTKGINALAIAVIMAGLLVSIDKFEISFLPKLGVLLLSLYIIYQLIFGQRLK